MQGSISVSQLLAWEPPDITEIIGEGLLALGGKAIIFGRWGSFKSMLAMDLGFAISCGRPWLGFRTVKSRVLWVQVEIPQHSLKKRVVKYTQYHAFDPDYMNIWTVPNLRIDNQYHFSQLEREIARVKPTVVIFDPVYQLMSGNISDNQMVSAFLSRIDSLHNTFEMSTVLVSHTRKVDPEKYDLGQELIGGSFFQNWVDTSIGLELLDQDTIRLQFLKARHAEDKIPDMKVTICRDTLQFISDRIGDIR